MSKKLEKFVKSQWNEVHIEHQTWLLKRSEGAKLLMVFIYLLTVAGVGKYELIKLIPLVLLPAWIAFELNMPKGTLLKRILLVEPMFLLVALVNPLIVKESIMIGSLSMSVGWITCISLMIKSTLTLCVVIELGIMLGIEGLCKGMRSLHIPSVFVDLTALTYRYLFVLSEEALALSRAYKMRAPEMSGVHFKTWGSFAGQLILRSFDRAMRIDQAMKLRGVNDVHKSSFKRFDRDDWLLIMAAIGYSIFIAMM